MQVARLQPDPVHRGQVPDRVRRVGVLDQLGLRGRARGEVEQQRVVGRGCRRRAAAGRRRRHHRRRTTASRPAVPDGDPDAATRLDAANFAVSAAPATTARTLPRLIRSLQVGRGEQGRRGDHHGAEPDAGRAWPPTAERRCRAAAAPGRRARRRAAVASRRSLRQLDRPRAYVSLVSLPSSSTIHSARRRACSAASTSNQSVAQLNSLELGPAEVAVGRVVVLAVREQEVARLAERRGRLLGRRDLVVSGHDGSLPVKRTSVNPASREHEDTVAGVTGPSRSDRLPVCQSPGTSSRWSRSTPPTGRPTSCCWTAAPPTCARSARTTPTGWSRSTRGCRRSPCTCGSSRPTRAVRTGTSTGSPRSTTCDRVAFVVTVGDEMIAVGRYDRARRTAEAEVAFLVEDGHQGRGLAQLLLEHLAQAGRERGLTRFVAEVLPGQPPDDPDVPRRRLPRRGRLRGRRGPARPSRSRPRTPRSA